MDEGLLSISQVGRDQFVKMLTTLEPYGIFGSNGVYIYNIILSRHIVRSRSFSEIAHNS